MRACGGNGSSPVGTWSGIEATCSGMSNFQEIIGCGIYCMHKMVSYQLLTRITF